MRRIVWLAVPLLVLGTLLPASAGTAPAGRDPNTDATIQPGSDAGFAVVELRGAPTATYTGGIRGLGPTKPEPGERLDADSPAVRAYRQHLARGRQGFAQWLARHHPAASIVREHDIVANAVAVRLNGTSPDDLRRGPSVARVGRPALYRPTMNVSTDLIDAAAMWAAAGGPGNAGEGMSVAIIDTGIDLTNHFFDPSGYADVPEVDACQPHEKPGGANTSDKVPVCRVYASGETSGPDDPVLLAFDHGTHVGGTVAGNFGTSGQVVGTSVVIDGLTGVAPRALLGDYNVFPGFGAGFVAFGGSAFSHDIAEALEDAVLDGMDVANMSLGGKVQGPHDFLAEAVDAAVDAGMVVAVAAGNSGPGDATVESPGSAPGALTAGASTNPHFVGIPVELGSGESYFAATGDFNPFDPPVTAPFTPTTPANGCTAITNDVSGQIAVIDRGACTFTTKIRNAENAGAVGVLVANNVAGDPTAMAHDGTDPFPAIPAAMVSMDDGAELKTLAGTTTMTVDGTSPQEAISDNEDIIAGFSSRGPTPFTSLIKPDVTGPGVNVLSSVFDDQFAFFQGTSMATPHVAGSAALLRQLHPDWSPDQVKSALVTTAKRPVWDHVTGTAPTGVLTRGGGRIDLAAATTVPATMVPSSVSFGFFQGNRVVQGGDTIELTNESGGVLSCSLQAVEAVDDPAVTVTVSPADVVLAPGESAHVAVSMTGGRDVGSGDYEGDIVADCGQTLMAPWWFRVDREGKP